MRRPIRSDGWSRFWAVTPPPGRQKRGAIAAQFVAHHLSRYIPGNPVVIFRQQPGAAHLNATNQIYNVAEPDGLTILAANPNVAMAQLAKVAQVRFDIRKF